MEDKSVSYKKMKISNVNMQKQKKKPSSLAYLKPQLMLALKIPVPETSQLSFTTDRTLPSQVLKFFALLKCLGTSLLRLSVVTSLNASSFYCSQMCFH